jgi:hypothetical protein
MPLPGSEKAPLDHETAAEEFGVVCRNAGYFQTLERFAAAVGGEASTAKTSDVVEDMRPERDTARTTTE